MTMEKNDKSESSIGDEKSNEGASSMKLESGESNIPFIKIYDETGRSIEVLQGSSISVQNESWKAQKNGSSACTIGKDLASKSSFTVGDENLKTSESMLSFTSTTAIYGSSSSDITSSEDEPSGDFEDVDKEHNARDIDSTPSNYQPDQQYEEIDNAGLTMVSRSKDQNKRLKVQEKLTSTCTIVKDSESNSSLRAENANMKTSESMLSFNSTAGTCGSSSPADISSDEEQLGDLEDISEKRETKHVFNLENPILELTTRDVKNVSNSQSTISLSIANFGDESQTKFEFTSTKGSLLQEDSTSLKPQDINNSLDKGTLQSLPKERLSRRIKVDEFPLQKSLSSTLDCFSDAEDPSSNNNPIDVPPLMRMESSLNSGEVETSDISYCSTTYGVVDYKSNGENCCLKEDKSLRRVPSLSEVVYCAFAPSIPGSTMKFEPSLFQVPKSFQQTLAPSIPDSSIKVEPSFSQVSKSLQQTSAPSIPDSSIKVEPSFSQVPKSLQQISPEEGDLNLYENCDRSAEVKFIKQKPWVKEMISSWPEIANTDAARGVETESLMEEVHNFFENNCAGSDVNTRPKEIKDQTTAKHFSAEMELLDMCKRLIEFSITEESFIEFARRQILMASGKECDLESIRESSYIEPQNYFSGLRFSITEDFNFFVIVKLYKKLMYEGATFLSILDESIAEEMRFRCRELLSKAQHSNSDLDDKIIDCPALYPTLNGESDTGSPSNSEGDVLQKVKSETESPKTHLIESNEASKVVSVSDSSALDSYVLEANEFGIEKTFLSLN